MKQANRTLLIVPSLLCAAAFAAPNAADQSAELTAKNIALVSSALTAHQNSVNAMATTRAAHILSVIRLGANAQRESDREVAILNRTGGDGIVKVFEALRDHGDQAALIFSQTAAAEAAAKADIAAAFTPLAISTEKLDRAAKTLAVLAKQQTDKERAKFLLQFLKDTRDESEKLAKASASAQSGADKKLLTAVAAAAIAASPSASGNVK